MVGCRGCEVVSRGCEFVSRGSHEVVSKDSSRGLSGLGRRGSFERRGWREVARSR